MAASPLSKMAVCVDGSASAEHVLRYALALAASSKDQHVKLRILRVAVASSPELDDVTDDACVQALPPPSHSEARQGGRCITLREIPAAAGNRRRLPGSSCRRGWPNPPRRPWLLGSRGVKFREQEDKEAREQAFAELMGLVSSVGTCRPANVELEILTPSADGSVADTLVKTLAEQPPGMCIIGSRGMGLTKKLLVGIADAILFAGLGSVSEELLHKANFPVCIVRPPMAALKKKGGEQPSEPDTPEKETEEKERFEEATEGPPPPPYPAAGGEDRVAEALDSAAL